MYHRETGSENRVGIYCRMLLVVMRMMRETEWIILAVLRLDDIPMRIVRKYSSPYEAIGRSSIAKCTCQDEKSSRERFSQ